jgi:hypothetical protein
MGDMHSAATWALLAVDASIFPLASKTKVTPWSSTNTGFMRPRLANQFSNGILLPFPSLFGSRLPPKQHYIRSSHRSCSFGRPRPIGRCGDRAKCRQALKLALAC